MSATPKTGIEVTGVGNVTTAPDVARVTLGVSVRDDSVTAASSRARDLAAAVIDALLADGVDRPDITTVSYSVFADHDHPKGRERLLGYRVNNELVVSIRDLSAVGAIIDHAVEAGGDATTVNRLSFEIEDEQEARDRAREAAWADAMGRAEHLATLSGHSLGAAVSIVESAGGAPSPRLAAAPLAAESTPIESGSATVSIRLQVRFALE